MKFKKKRELRYTDKHRVPYSERPYNLSNPISKFTVNIYQLIYPYHFHVYLMYLFLEFYSENKTLYKYYRFLFFLKAKKEPFYKFSMKIKPKNKKKTKKFINSFIKLYNDIKQNGFSLEKRVPVSINKKGHIVPLKGGKRMAILLKLGITEVPVVELKVNEKKLTPDKRKNLVRNYTKIIKERFKNSETIQKALKEVEMKYLKLRTPDFS